MSKHSRKRMIPPPPRFSDKVRHFIDKLRSKKGNGSTLFGKISLTSSGYGFVAPEGGNRDIFIPAHDTFGAMDGDRVEVVLIDPKSLPSRFAGKGDTGRVIKIVERGRKTLVGELFPGGLIIPMNKRLTTPVRLSGGTLGAKPGVWVEVGISPAGSGAEGLRGTVKSVIGESATIAGDLDAVVAEYGLPPPYTPEENAAAEKLLPLEIERESPENLFCVSIDPFDAKDHDDALSIQNGPTPDTVILGVHISDVAAYIQPATPWDRAAKMRAFTAYLPGRTLPLLPRTLTARMSLLPGKKCAAQSVYFIVRRSDGTILEHRHCCSWVEITHSFNYDEVQSFLDGETVSWSEETRLNLTELTAVTRKLRANRRRDEQFLNMAVPELRVVVDERAGIVAGIENRTLRESENIVEEAMLLANSAIAVELHSKNIPAVYRIHAEPEPEKLERFAVDMFEAFGLSVGDLSTREACNAFLSELPDDDNKTAILNAFLRALPRALYSSECLGHYGLGKSAYLHFTSPIRRYPDLLVHRQLHAVCGHGRLISGAAMTDAALDCTEKEQIVDDAYYAANDRMKLHYLRQLIENGLDPEYPAIVNRILPNGVLIEIHAIGLQGLIEPQDLIMRQTGSPKYSPKARKGKAAKVTELHLLPGERLTVRVSRIDWTKGTVAFAPVQTQKSNVSFRKKHE